MNNFSNSRITHGHVATTFKKQKLVIVAHWLVKYINRIFSGIGFQICVAKRIRIRIPTSWTRTEVGLEKTWVRTHLYRTRFWYWNLLHQLCSRGCRSHISRLRLCSCSKILTPGPEIFQIWVSDSCSDCGFHWSNREFTHVTKKMTKETHATAEIDIFKDKPSKRNVENIRCDMQKP